MDKQEIIKRFLEQVPKGKATTTGELIDAAASIGESAAVIADFIIDFMEVYEIDANEGLAYLYAEQEKAQKVRAELKRKESLIAAIDDTGGRLANLRAIIDTATPAEIAAEAAGMSKRFAGIGEAGNKSPFITFENYLEERVGKKYWAEFAPDLFNNLPFPDGTLSAIGAAPGSGKSAALVNLCRELLTTKPTDNKDDKGLKQDTDAKRNILFLSAEMPIPDIVDRLVHCLAWQEMTYRVYCEFEEVHRTNTDYWRCLKAITGKAPEHMTFTPQELHRGEAYKEVLETYIRPAWGNRLKIAYVRGYQTFEEVTNIIINNAAPGSLVLMDYLQLFPPVSADAGIDGSGGNLSSPRYLQIRHVIDQAILAAEETKSVIIAAAQLGRETRKEGTAQGVDDTQGWRESGDIEQSGWNLIKMFLETNEDNPAEKQLSYRVSKCRSAPNLGEGYIMDWIPGYQFMERTEGVKAPPPWIEVKKKKPKKDPEPWVKKGMTNDKAKKDISVITRAIIRGNKEE
jgi:hypothetical protein